LVDRRWMDDYQLGGQSWYKIGSAPLGFIPPVLLLYFCEIQMTGIKVLKSTCSVKFMIKNRFHQSLKRQACILECILVLGIIFTSQTFPLLGIVQK